MNLDKVFIILRGVPGCGKSSLAELLADMGDNVGTICTADDYFVVNGEYKFEPSKLGEAHEVCKNKAMEAMANGERRIILANTNCRKKDLTTYKTLAKKYNYTVFVLVVENHHGNNSIHGVPEETRERMANTLLNNIKLI